MTTHAQTTVAAIVMVVALAGLIGVVIGYHLRPRGRGSRGRS